LKLIQGDCIEVMKKLEANSVDTVITDPPYGLEFMGKEWDSFTDNQAFQEWTRQWATEALRVAKPGAMMLCFGGTRTFHRIACGIEDAGWEIRDTMMWLYGSGFPKSYNMSKGMDKYLKTGNASWNGTGDSSKGALGYSKLQHKQGYRPNDYSDKHQHKAEITEDRAKLWDGWGTALKPAFEPIIVAMKPREGTYVENALKWGVAGLNINGGRVPTNGESVTINTWDNGAKPFGDGAGNPYTGREETEGRWPANIIHDGSEEVLEGFPESKSTNSVRKNNAGWGTKGIYGTGNAQDSYGFDDKGSAARFFYTAKASKKERNAGLDSTCTMKYNIPKSIGGILCRDVSTELVELLRKVTLDIAGVKWVIGESGVSIMGLCQQDTLSTTLMKISKITESKILHLLQQWNISVSTQDVSCETVSGGSPAKFVGSSAPLTKIIGTSQKRDGLYTDAVKDVILELLSKASVRENWQIKGNIHSTVKPLSLMVYLAKLTKTPTGGVVLDPFMGSGTTGMACKKTGRDFIGIELDPHYFEIAEKRIASVIQTELL